MEMNPFIRYLYTVIALCCFGATIHADYMSISSSGDSFELNAGVFDILSGSSNQFAMSDLDVLAATLQGDGIETSGKLSFMLASTDAGMSFIGLFDGVSSNNPTGSISDQLLGVSTTTSIGTDWYSTGDEGSQTSWYDLGNNMQMVNSMLAWDQGQTSAGFAWGDVQQSASGTFNLYDLDLTEFGAEPIQFVTYQDDHWAVAGTASFTVLGQYAFSYQFIPAPSAFALFAIGGLTGRRIRRRI